MAVVAAIFLVVSFVSAFYPLQDRPENEIIIKAGLDDASGYLEYNVTPYTELLNAKVVKQTYDFSCGSAALCTLLNFNYGEELEETQVIQGLMRHGDSKKIEERRAFSLLDMKGFVKVLGYNGVGYQAEIKDLQTLKEPGILPIEIFGYKHFVVFKGIYDGHVFLADPSKGNISFTLNKFEEVWPEKVIFVIYPETFEQKWHPLRLTDKDLNYIDVETSLGRMLETLPLHTLPIEQDLLEQTGRTYFYRTD